MDTGIDITKVLGPGVYLLRQGDRVAYVGKARCILMALYAHRVRNTAPGLADWFPIKHIPFDAITIHPTTVDRAHQLAASMIELYNPPHNRKPHQRSTPNHTPRPPTPPDKVLRL